MLKLKLQYFGHLTHLKRPWCWERLKAGGEGDNRGWDGWMASPTPRTWVWVNSRSWWWAGRPGVLQFMGLQRVGTTERLNWTELIPSLQGLPPLPDPIPPGHHRAAGWAPYATQQLLTSNSSYTWECMCWSYFIHSSHSLPPPHCPQVHSPHPHLHSGGDLLWRKRKRHQCT